MASTPYARDAATTWSPAWPVSTPSRTVAMGADASHAGHDDGRGRQWLRADDGRAARRARRRGRRLRPPAPAGGRLAAARRPVLRRPDPVRADETRPVRRGGTDATHDRADGVPGRRGRPRGVGHRPTAARGGPARTADLPGERPGVARRRADQG